MLRRWSNAPRRVLAVSLAAARPSIAARPVAAPTRSVSLWSWRRSHPPAPPPLPVYFSRGEPVSRTGNWRKPLGRALFAIVAYTVCWQIYATVVFNPLFDWVDREWSELSDEEKDEMDRRAAEDEPILFLPFPFLTKLVEQPPYKGSDPEWATFLSINRDQGLQEEIKRGLAKLVLMAALKNPQCKLALGEGKVVVKKYWLDIIYPPSPPPKHYMSGIIFFDDGIYWGYQPIESSTANSLNGALYPQAVATAVWAFCNSLFAQTVHHVANAVRSNPPQSPSEATSPHQSTSQTDVSHVFGVPVRPEASGRPTTSISEAKSPNASGSGGSLESRIQAALEAAGHVLVKNWHAVPQHPNRGCIRVDGMVEIHGTDATLCVYVLALYDPKLKKYVNVQTAVKHLVQHRQRPAAE